MRLEGKVALVSGAARGMGAAESTLFAEEGASVVVADIQTEPGKEVAAGISRSGGRARFVELAVTWEKSWQRAMEETVGCFGRLDVLVNNAGTGYRSSFEDTPLEAWNRVNDVPTCHRSWAWWRPSTRTSPRLRLLHTRARRRPSGCSPRPPPPSRPDSGFGSTRLFPDSP